MLVTHKEKQRSWLLECFIARRLITQHAIQPSLIPRTDNHLLARNTSLILVQRLIQISQPSLHYSNRIRTEQMKTDPPRRPTDVLRKRLAKIPQVRGRPKPNHMLNLDSRLL